MNERPTAIVFDLDGVLVDSRVPITKSIDYALETLGLPRQQLDRLERFIGPPLTVAFAELVGQPPDSPLVLACLASYREHYSEASLRETTVFPGIPEALAGLAGSHRLAVATSKPLAFAEPLLGALGLRANFDHVAGPDLDVNREGKQTTIGRVLSALDTTRAVMVGDRSFDVAGAHACGIPAIGVSWGIGDITELTAAGAEMIVNDPMELHGAVSDLLPDQTADDRPLVSDRGMSRADGALSDAQWRALEEVEAGRVYRDPDDGLWGSMTSPSQVGSEVVELLVQQGLVELGDRMVGSTRVENACVLTRLGEEALASHREDT